MKGITVTDQFCGAGGSSQGARRLGIEVELAMNHWDLAIETHNTNFPETEHDCADISSVKPSRYWATDILITSPSCTNHSVAKGQKRVRAQRSLLGDPQLDPAAVRSRATMWDVVNFAEHHKYKVIIVENVVDARKWRLWDSWLSAMHNLGYLHHVVYLNSMFAHLDPASVNAVDDFVPQSRDRLYVVFWLKGNKAPDLNFRPKSYCPTCDKVIDAEQSWKKSPGTAYWRWGRYKAQYVYRCTTCASEVTPFHFAAANAIDWSLPAERIGDRKRPLRPKTLARIKKGLTRFAGQHLVVDLAFTHGGDKYQLPLAAPLRTQTTRQTASLVFLPFLLGYANQNGPARAAIDALRTFHTENGQGVVLPPFLNINYSPGYNKRVDEPFATHTASDHHSLLLPAVTTLRSVDGKKNGVHYATRGVDDPLSTQVTATQQALMYLPFMTELRGTQDKRSVRDALATICASGSHHALSQAPFISLYYGSSDSAKTIDNPAHTFVSKDKHGLVQPSAMPDVEDCLFRMLQPHEIGRGMAFDNDYVVLGSKRDQVKQYGNAVTPPAMLRILERVVEALT